MPPKSVASDRIRMPEQHVRPGRGVPGYTGNVEIIPTKAPATYEATGVISTGDKPKDAEAKNSALSDRRALVEKAKALGIPANLKSAELEAAIAEKEAEANA